MTLEAGWVGWCRWRLMNSIVGFGSLIRHACWTREALPLSWYHEFIDSACKPRICKIVVREARKRC